MNLHDYIYDAVCDVCYDKEYLYPCFLRAFHAVTTQIYEHGGVRTEGACLIRGLKSEHDIRVQWRLERRMSFYRQNEVLIELIKTRKTDGRAVEQRSESFDISSGDAI